MKKIVFHPDINAHKTNNDYTKKMYALLQELGEVVSLEWYMKHPSAKDVQCLYLNWFENTVKGTNAIIQRLQYGMKLSLLKKAKKKNVKIVYVIHNKTPHNVEKASSLYQKIVKPFMEKSLNLADVVVELCEHTESYLESEFHVPDLHQKMKLVPHGKYEQIPCDLSTYREKYQIAEGEMVFCFVGRIDRYKNVDLVIKAFYESQVQGKLIIAGSCEESYQEQLKALVQDSQVVCNFSRISDEEMSAILQISDATILPYEKTSINSGVMINAFSNGATVIGTDVEMLQDYSDELVYGYDFDTKEDHLKNLAKKMLEAFEDHKQGNLSRKGEALRERMEKENSWEIVREKLMKLMES